MTESRDLKLVIFKFQFNPISVATLHDQTEYDMRDLDLDLSLQNFNMYQSFIYIICKYIFNNVCNGKIFLLKLNIFPKN